jgi:Zn-dependent peptidase ImmA (M78 family)
MHDPPIPLSAVTPTSLRLKEARTAAGLSTRVLAELIAKRFSGLKVSHATLANCEKGSSAPNIELIGAYAVICDRPIGWFVTKGIALTGVQYRFLSSKTSVKERHQFECQAQYWLEAYLRLERRIGERLKAVKRCNVTPSMSAESAAQSVRKSLGLEDSDSIPSVIRVLEEFGIRVIEMPTPLEIDGFAARFGHETVVVLNPSSANDRCRMNAAHELAHVLFRDCDSPNGTTQEMDNRAFEFASYLLIPRSQLEKALSGQSAVRLLRYKELFGVSMAAMIFRGEKCGILDERTTKRLWIQFSRRGWRLNEPGTVRPDRAVRMEELLDRAISEKRLSWSEAASVMGVTVMQLKERRDLAMGILVEGGGEGGETLKIHN